MSTASSPCTGVCTIPEARARCLGCGRTLDEIAGWGGMSEAERLALMTILPRRLAEDGARRWTRGSADPN